MKRINILTTLICAVLLTAQFSFSQVLINPNITISTEAANRAISQAIPANGTNNYSGSLDGNFSYTYITDKAISITIPAAQKNTTASTFNFDGLGVKNIKKWSSGVLSDVAAGDLIGTVRLRYDGTQFVLEGGGGSSGGSSVYAGASPTTTTVGGLASGSAISGLSYDDIFESILVPYVNPVFTSFSITGQSTTVEVGTTLSGSKTFTWGINAGSGTVSTIDLYNVTTSATLLAGTPNDGTQAQTITTVQLNSSGATQVWRGIGNNSAPSGTFNSSNFTVTGWFYRFSGPTSTAPTNSATVRALPVSAFVTGAGSFTLATGTTEINFMVCLPPGRSITSVIDTDALGADITSNYVLQSSINVLDAGGTNRAYVIYKCTNAVPYGVSHNHVVTFN